MHIGLCSRVGRPDNPEESGVTGSNPSRVLLSREKSTYSRLSATKLTTLSCSPRWEGIYDYPVE